ncbi:MAG: hypothetical protein J7513_09865 [Solirubrobacteraceae bacterium]|nr:hypothetical protein [Solirubrobacteraceae bacterium]
MRSQPMVLVAAILAVIAGLFVLNRGNGHAERVPEQVAHTSPGGSPLDAVLTADQRARFERATSTLSLVAYAEALPVKRAKALAAGACADLDTSVPLLAALEQTCEPTVNLRVVSMKLRRTCASGDDDCGDNVRARARAQRRVAQADRVYARAVRRAVPKGECREALAPTHDFVAAEFGYARAFDRMADAMDEDDDAALEEARRTAGKHDEVITDGLVWHRTRDMAEACNLEPWAFEAPASVGGAAIAAAGSSS